MRHVFVVTCFLANGIVVAGLCIGPKCMRLRGRVEAAVTGALLHDVVDDTRQCMCMIFPKTLKPKSNPFSEVCGRVEAAVTAALLHDVVDDTPVALEDVASRFGERIAGIVAQVSQLSNTNQLLRRQRRKQARAPPADPAFRPRTHRLHAAFEHDRVHARCLCRRTYLSSMQRLVW